MRPGRHGGMASSELELLLARNGNFLSVRRAGSGDGYASLHNSITGDFILGINGGWLPEYSRMQNLQQGCLCTPRSECRTGKHGTNLLRGWRNILHELVSRNRVRMTPEILRVLGREEYVTVADYGLRKAPETEPAPAWDYRQLRSA